MATNTSPAQGYGVGSFFGDIAKTLNDAARYRLIDREVMQTQQNLPDTTDVRTGQTSSAAVYTTGIGDVFRNLEWWQWGGLAVAAGLTWGLATGKFS